MKMKWFWKEFIELLQTHLVDGETCHKTAKTLTEGPTVSHSAIHTKLDIFIKNVHKNLYMTNLLYIVQNHLVNAKSIQTVDDFIAIFTTWFGWKETALQMFCHPSKMLLPSHMCITYITVEVKYTDKYQVSYSKRYWSLSLSSHQYAWPLLYWLVLGIQLPWRFYGHLERCNNNRNKGHKCPLLLNWWSNYYYYFQLDRWDDAIV